MEVEDKDILPAASGSGGELTAWKPKLLYHLIGVDETRIPLGITLGHWSDLLPVLYVCTSQALKIEG